MIKAVIFDMDGTLVDTEPIYHRTNEKLYQDLGIQILKEEYDSFVGIDSKKKWSYIKETYELDQPLTELMAFSKKHKFENLSQISIEVFPGIIELIESVLSRGLSIALASSSNWQLINLILSKTGLDKYFNTKVSGEDIENGKPAPDIFIQTAKLLDLATESCIVLEDSENGVKGALAANMVAVGHKTANSQQDLNDAHLVINAYTRDNCSAIIKLIDSQA